MKSKIEILAHKAYRGSLFETNGKTWEELTENEKSYWLGIVMAVQNDLIPNEVLAIQQNLEECYENIEPFWLQELRNGKIANLAAYDTQIQVLAHAYLKLQTLLEKLVQEHHQDLLVEDLDVQPTFDFKMPPRQKEMKWKTKEKATPNGDEIKEKPEEEKKEEPVSIE